MPFKSLTTYLLQNTNLHYVIKFTYAYAIQATSFAFIFLTSAIICKLVGRYLTSKRVQKPSISMRNYEPILYDDEDEHLVASQIECDIPFEELKEFLKEKKSSQSLLGRRFLVVSEILEIGTISCFAFVLSVFSSRGLISVALSMFLTFLFLLLTGIMIMRSFCPIEIKNLIRVKRFKNFRQSRPQIQKELYCAFKLEPTKCFALVGFILLYTLVIPLMFSRTCLAAYQPNTAYNIFTIKTAFSRWISLPQICPKGEICHIYSTLAEDASTSVFLNVHTGIDVDSLEANYDTRSNFEGNKKGVLAMKKTGFDHLLDLDSTGSRYLHSIYLDNLEPATDYYVKFLYKGKELGEANFTTFPSEKMEKNIVMVVGGDSSGNKIATAFIKELGNYNPDVILVGGDIAYDNGDQNCYYCWDYYLNQLEALNKHRGKLIPLILAFGNHDVGQDDGQLLGVDPYQNNLMLFFPQHSNFDAKNPGVPKPEDRMSYFYKKIGNMLHISLDTGYLSEFNGKQLTWLQNTARKFPTLAKFANYHVPMFPACFYNPLERGYDARVQTWAPVFEENKFLTVFENHMHLFKRTFPLKFGSGDGPGVVYLGDGAWGIKPKECYNEDPNRNVSGVFETMGNLNHIWILNISFDTVAYNALGRDGKIFDNYSQKITDYIG